MKQAAIAILMLCAGVARANEKPAPATFALIVGVNQSQDEKLGTLRYADDDAARYQELFRSLGARTYLVTRLDDSSRRLHPQAEHPPGSGPLDHVQPPRPTHQRRQHHQPHDREAEDQGISRQQEIGGGLRDLLVKVGTQGLGVTAPTAAQSSSCWSMVLRSGK